VTSIGQSTFYNCTSLTSVTINGNPRMGPQAFPSNATVSLNLTANSAGGANWMTFYNDLYRFQADANTTVYKGTISDNRLMLTEVADKIVNVGTAVILKSMGNPVMTLASTNSSNMNTNDLKGVMEDTDTPPNCYTLANESEGLGFYQYTGEKIHAGKAYIIYNGGTSREFIGLDSDAGDGDATRLKEERINNKEIKSEWYMLSGARLSGKPTAKGIYIVKGRKVIR